ncbi:MAG TPA: hypothetical protein VJ951_03740 [Bacteroidales bacterium]|nr:hypothetical protein [Bacteroidales bacterium]
MVKFDTPEPWGPGPPFSMSRVTGLVMAKYLDKELFKSFTIDIDYGDLIWNDYEMCFPIWALYEGRI